MVSKGLRRYRLSCSVIIKKAKDQRLYMMSNCIFSNRKKVDAGQRVFDVVIQGKVVLDDFDIAREAKGSNIGVAKYFSDIEISDELNIKLKPVESSSIKETIICGIELTHVNK